MSTNAHAAAEIGRIAFYIGRFPMANRDRSALLSSLHLWWSSGRRGLARLRGVHAKRSGAVTHAHVLIQALVRLEAQGVVARRGFEEDRIWDLLDPVRWKWPEGTRALADAAWEQSVSSAGWLYADAMDLLRHIVERLPDTAWIGTRRGRPVFHPDDRASRDWHDQIKELAEEFGEAAMMDALREIGEDPETMPRWSPGVLRTTAWAAAIRRRARVGP